MDRKPDEIILGECVFNLLHQLIDDLPPEFRHWVSKKPGDYYISLPYVLINFMNFYRGYTFRGLYSQHPNSLKTFEGIELVPSHELAITLFHKDGPLYQDQPGMISKIPFTGLSKKTENGGILFMLKKVFDFKDQSFSQN